MWIIKDPNHGYPYVSHRGGGVWAPCQRSAHRFATLDEARRVLLHIQTGNNDIKSARIVRLVPKRKPVTEFSEELWISYDQQGVAVGIFHTEKFCRDDAKTYGDGKWTVKGPYVLRSV
jgi:hypothetical protein